MSNTYTVHFYAECPTNRARISYTLQITSRSMIPVEEILTAADSTHEGYHEEIADDMLKRFGGTQKLEAEHHGVHISTLRARA